MMAQNQGTAEPCVTRGVLSACGESVRRRTPGDTPGGSFRNASYPICSSVAARRSADTLVEAEVQWVLDVGGHGA